eukprot:5583104-Amphidinium_carterae.1
MLQMTPSKTETRSNRHKPSFKQKYCSSCKPQSKSFLRIVLAWWRTAQCDIPVLQTQKTISQVSKLNYKYNPSLVHCPSTLLLRTLGGRGGGRPVSV